MTSKSFPSRNGKPGKGHVIQGKKDEDLEVFKPQYSVLLPLLQLACKREMASELYRGLAESLTNITLCGLEGEALGELARRIDFGSSSAGFAKQAVGVKSRTILGLRNQNDTHLSNKWNLMTVNVGSSSNVEPAEVRSGPHLGCKCTRGSCRQKCDCKTLESYCSEFCSCNPELCTNR